MNDDELRRVVCATLATIAPEADLDTLEPEVELREQLDLDSMDFLNFLIGLDAATGVDIPERDYPELTTLDACVAYLRSRIDPA